MGLVGGTVLLMWLSLAGASLIFARFQADFSDLAAAQIPRMALVGELASQSARLTTIATGIIGADHADHDAGGDSPADLSGLEEVASALSVSLSLLLDGQDGQESQVLDLISQLRKQLAALVPLAQTRRDHVGLTSARLDALRWLNADIQNEIDPLLSDYDFNIRALMLRLEDDHEAPTRTRMLRQMSQERGLRETVLQIGVETGTLVTLLVQASVAGNPRQIDQLEDLGFDLLARLSEHMTRLPEGDEFLTLHQSVGLLRGYFDPDSGLIRQRRETLALDGGIYERIRNIQQGLAVLQSTLSTLSENEKQTVLHAIEHGATQARVGLAVLVALTAALALAAVTLVFGVMSRQIVQPMRDLTSRLVQISEAADAPLGNARGRDDIARMRNAVDEFAKAIRTRDEAIADLRRTQKDLVQAGKMAALGKLSAGISHELNQPLAALRYRLELLDNAAMQDDPDAARRQIALTIGLAERMQAIIGHLQRFARQAGSKHAPVALAPVVANALALLQGRLTEAGITPQIGPGISGAWVIGNEVLIGQVLVNLLTNALDAVDGAANPVISINAVQRDGMIDLTVTDNGIGLGDLAPDDVVNPFVSSKQVGRGMGLGLSISYNIAKDMGGDLQLTPHEGAGVIARLRLQPNRGQSAIDNPTDKPESVM